jgi:hypothetical protein
VKECHEAAANAAARFLVDHAKSSLLAALERSRHVGAAVGGMVNAGPALREEFAYRRVFGQWREQFDVRVSNPQQRSLDTLLGNGLAVLEGHPELLAVELD